MDSSEQKELERFIDEQLKKLPDREAPAELVAKVLQSIEERENKPWYKQPFTSWSQGRQALLIGGLTTLVAGATYLAWAPAEQLSLNSLAEQVRPFAWVADVSKTIIASMVLAIRNMPALVLAAIAGIFISMYAACVGAGVALYRVTALGHSTHRDPR
jgi:hypothetical protein